MDDGISFIRKEKASADVLWQRGNGVALGIENTNRLVDIRHYGATGYKGCGLLEFLFDKGFLGLVDAEKLIALALFHPEHPVDDV